MRVWPAPQTQAQLGSAPFFHLPAVQFLRPLCLEMLLSQAALIESGYGKNAAATADSAKRQKVREAEPSEIPNDFEVQHCMRNLYLNLGKTSIGVIVFGSRSFLVLGFHLVSFCRKLSPSKYHPAQGLTERNRRKLKNTGKVTLFRRRLSMPLKMRHRNCPWLSRRSRRLRRCLRIRGSSRQHGICSNRGGRGFHHRRSAETFDMMVAGAGESRTPCASRPRPTTTCLR